MPKPKPIKPFPGNTRARFRPFLLLLLFVPACLMARALPEAQSGPMHVQVGLMIDQIVNVDQKAQNFTAAYTLQMRYRDPYLAYETGPDGPPFRTYTMGGFLSLLEGEGRNWPGFAFGNQQGRRDINVEDLRVHPNGEVVYYERATVTLQAPDFDFRAFPFDQQIFNFHIHSLLPESMVVFEPIAELSGMGEQLGEEEWMVIDTFTEVDSDTTHSGVASSRFTLGFAAKRHLLYYVIRIFVPIIVILTVSWFSFRLHDYVKRVDMGVTVLLLFIAFNFTLTADLPRLGYLTAIDAFLAGSFLITGAVILVNVQLRYLQRVGRDEDAQRLDRIAIFGYWPAYILGMSAALLML